MLRFLSDLLRCYLFFLFKIDILTFRLAPLERFVLHCASVVPPSSVCTLHLSGWQDLFSLEASFEWIYLSSVSRQALFATSPTEFWCSLLTNASLSLTDICPFPTLSLVFSENFSHSLGNRYIIREADLVNSQHMLMSLMIRNGP